MGHGPSSPLRETMVGNGVESGGSGPGAPLLSFGDGVRPMNRARAAAALPEACRHVPYIVAPGSLRENNEQ